MRWTTHGRIVVGTLSVCEESGSVGEHLGISSIASAGTGTMDHRRRRSAIVAASTNSRRFAMTNALHKNNIAGENELGSAAPTGSACEKRDRISARLNALR